MQDECLCAFTDKCSMKKIILTWLPASSRHDTLESKVLESIDLYFPYACSKILLLSGVSFGEPAASPFESFGSLQPRVYVFLHYRRTRCMSPFGLRALSCNATYTSTLETGRVNFGCCLSRGLGSWKVC